MQNLLYAVYVVSYLGLVVIAYRLGRRHGRDAAEEAQERLLRLEPPDRTPGLPTNTEADPSTPREVRWRSGRFGGDSHM
jgi:hypothetical protein